jgi:hypothetical protein
MSQINKAMQDRLVIEYTSIGEQEVYSYSLMSCLLLDKTTNTLHFKYDGFPVQVKCFQDTDWLLLHMRKEKLNWSDVETEVTVWQSFKFFCSKLFEMFFPK